MNLKFRLNLIITLLLLFVMVIGAFAMIRNAREDVRAEVQSTAFLAIHLLDAEILHYTSDYSWLSGINQNKASIFRLQSLDNVRHLKIEFFDAAGRLRDSNREIKRSFDDSPPRWFLKMIDVVSTSMPPVRRQVFAGGRLLGELVVTPDPSYEISEIWNDTVGLLILIAIFFVIVNVMIYWVVGRALGPINHILDALVEFEHGNLDARLPKITLPELTAISDKFNSMAQVMQNSVRSNHLLTQKIIFLQEEERKSLARDLHDEIGQHLAAIHIDATAILNAKSIKDARESAIAIDVVARQVMNIVHDMLQFLRPSGLDVLGLSAAVKDLVDIWGRKNSKITVHLEFKGEVDDVDETVSIVVYRLVQECLTNITRHADAHTVSISIARKSGVIELEISDDGRGLDTKVISSGFGLAGMNERVQGAGGTFYLDGVLGAGVKIRAVLPFKEKVAS